MNRLFKFKKLEAAQCAWLMVFNNIEGGSDSIRVDISGGEGPTTLSCAVVYQGSPDDSFTFVRELHPLTVETFGQKAVDQLDEFVTFLGYTIAKI